MSALLINCVLEAILRFAEVREIIKDSQCGSSKNKSCLNIIVDYYDLIMTISADKRRAMDLIYLDFCKAFDRVHHNIFLSKAEGYEFDGWSVCCIRKFLYGCNQSVVVNDSMFRWRSVLNVVPQGFLLRPLLYNILLNDRQWDEVCPLQVCR